MGIEHDKTSSRNLHAKYLHDHGSNLQNISRPYIRFESVIRVGLGGVDRPIEVFSPSSLWWRREEKIKHDELIKSLALLFTISTML